MPRKKRAESPRISAADLATLRAEMDGRPVDEYRADAAMNLNPIVSRLGTENLPIMDQALRQRQEEMGDLATLYNRFNFEAGEYEIEVHRSFPKFHQGLHVGGHLATYYDPVYSADIEREHGGGRMKVVLYGDSPKYGAGRFYLGSTKIEVAGPPKPRTNGTGSAGGKSEEEAAPAAPRQPEVGESAATSRVFAFFEREAERKAQEVAEAKREASELVAKLGQRGGQQADLGQLFTQMVGVLSGQSSEQRTEMRELFQLVKGDDSAQKGLLQIAQQHQAEMATVRERFEGELSRVRAEADRRIDAERDRAMRDREDVQRSSDRQIDMLRDQHALVAKAIEGAYEGRLQAYRDSLDLARAELERLRATAPPDTLDQLNRVVQLKEAIDRLAGKDGSKKSDDDDEDDKPKGAFDRLLGMAERMVDSPGGNRILESLVSRAMTPQVQQVQQVQPTTVQQIRPPVAPTPATPAVAQRRPKAGTKAEAKQLAEQLETMSGGVLQGPTEEEKQKLMQAMRVLSALEAAAKQPPEEVDYAKLEAAVREGMTPDEVRQLAAGTPEQVLDLLALFVKNYELPVMALFSSPGREVVAHLIERLKAAA
jgi:hypothetical protein